MSIKGDIESGQLAPEYPECRHPLHAEPPANTTAKSRCMCWNCLAQRDSVLANAIVRMVDVVERGNLHQIQSQAANLDSALWDTKLYLDSGAAKTIAEANGPEVASLRAKNAALREFLQYLDRLGGLGHTIHERIKTVLKETA